MKRSPKHYSDRAKIAKSYLGAYNAGASPKELRAIKQSTSPGMAKRKALQKRLKGVTGFGEGSPK